MCSHLRSFEHDPTSYGNLLRMSFPPTLLHFRGVFSSLETDSAKYQRLQVVFFMEGYRTRKKVKAFVPSGSQSSNNDGWLNVS